MRLARVINNTEEYCSLIVGREVDTWTRRQTRIIWSTFVPNIFYHFEQVRDDHSTIELIEFFKTKTNET